ncbi:glycoside hydrolase [Lysobacteraceae bacterium NML93-0792]|nr:glycoside hydrolase [Xanthomonadaceae bacterium NML93-0792]PBS15562.1 glycoside hydrolase [Xanthomonadaceae bacterium NML93-0793]PBS18315.1 glycoside hydrolase [Xanthomonadaceae bacterium NML93-0831]
MTDAQLGAHASRTRRLRTALLASVLTLATAPAFAGPGLAGDSADQLEALQSTSVAKAITAPTVQLPQPEMLLASDINQLIALEVDKPVAADGRVETLLKRALTLIGTPYRWGGSSPDSGFDCSGLVGYVFRTALGIDLPRVSRDMAQNGERVERASLNAGDLVFFGRRGNRIDHVGIYLGEGRFVHAPRTGKDVMVSELDSGYWATRFKSARRVAGV